MYAFVQPEDFAIPAAYSGYSVQNRTLFNLTNFAAAAGLGQPVAANYWYTENSNDTAPGVDYSGPLVVPTASATASTSASARASSAASTSARSSMSMTSSAAAGASSSVAATASGSRPATASGTASGTRPPVASFTGAATKVGAAGGMLGLVGFGFAALL